MPAVGERQPEVAISLVSVGSSSSGNSYIIKAGGQSILLDVGLSAKRIVEALEQCGLQPEELTAVLITHEHVDHVKSVRAIARKCPNAIFYASRGTIEACENFKYVPEERCRVVAKGELLEIGDATLRCFGLSHDAAEPIGYSVLSEGQQLTVVTDTGVVTREIFEELLGADLLVFEANHEESMLMYGPYPYSVKMRIKSDYGHLSNVSSAEVLAQVIKRGASSCPAIMLAHLSEQNNSPYQARITIEDVLRQSGLERDVDYSMTIASKEFLSYLGNEDWPSVE